MLKHLRDFFKTLKMEVFGVGVEGEDLQVESAVISENVDITEPDVEGFEVEVIVDEDAIGGKVEIEDFKGFEQSLETLSGEFKSTEVEIASGDLKATFEVSGVPLKLSSEVRWEKVVGFKASVEGVDGIKTAVLKGDAPPLWVLTLKRAPLVEKEKVLDALARLLRKYGGRPEGMEFLGYFKGVPIGSAEALIVEKGRLVLRISKRKRRNVMVDLVAIKTPKGVMVEVVR